MDCEQRVFPRNKSIKIEERDPYILLHCRLFYFLSKLFFTSGFYFVGEKKDWARFNLPSVLSLKVHNNGNNVGNCSMRV